MSQSTANPFFETWTRPFGAPPFDRIREEHFRPAFEAGVVAQAAEVAAIVENKEEPSFADTIEAFEACGRDLRRVGMVFYNLAGSNSNEELRAIERAMAPILARHRAEIYLNPKLFARVDAVHARRASLGLASEQARLVERIHKGFVRAGARLSDAERARLASITEELASLGTRFSQNTLKDESESLLLLENEADLAGLTEDFLASAAELAERRGHPGRHAVSLARGMVESFLAFSTRRDLRETLLAMFLSRGERGGESDNRDVIAQTLRLRDESARLLGYASYAQYKLDDTMAETPEAVRGLLDEVWAPGRARALREAERLQALINDEGGNFDLASHDWRHYAEKIRRRDYAIDDAEMRPYFPLQRMIEAAFYVAGRLFGVTFEERTDLPVYHPDVRTFEARDRDGNHLALFYGDYFARASKRSGAWMSAFRAQQKFGGEARPIIVNVLNIARPPDGEQALLGVDDARTLFHEFGHALHGMLSDVTYSTLAGTAVATDFVELPSQLFEHWLLQPEVLKRFARRMDTNEPLPDELAQRLIAARAFNQGFATVEYCSCAFVDLDMHLDPAAAAAPLDFERRTLERIEKPAAIPMRHRSPHFTHVFAGEGYAAGYYSYLWSETLDADAFAAFEETGDIFDAEVARKLRDYIYAAGNLRDPRQAYLAFRGRLPNADALLAKRGLA